MKKDAALPNSICAECYKQIETCYSFRKNCLNTYQKLKKHLQALKMKEANTTQYLTVQNTVANKSSVLNNPQFDQDRLKLNMPEKLNLDSLIDEADKSLCSNKNQVNIPIESIHKDLENTVKTENLKLFNDLKDITPIDNTKKESDNNIVNIGFVKKDYDFVNMPTESINKNENIVNMESVSKAYEDNSVNSVNIPIESINKELDRILSTEGLGNDYVDIVLVINENSVQILDTEKQIENKKIMELCGTAATTDKQNVLQVREFFIKGRYSFIIIIIIISY